MYLYFMEIIFSDLHIPVNFAQNVPSDVSKKSYTEVHKIFRPFKGHVTMEIKVGSKDHQWRTSTRHNAYRQLQMTANHSCHFLRQCKYNT